MEDKPKGSVGDHASRTNCLIQTVPAKGLFSLDKQDHLLKYLTEVQATAFAAIEAGYQLVQRFCLLLEDLRDNQFC